MIKVAIIEDDPEVVEKLTSAIAAGGDLVVSGLARNATDGKELAVRGGYDVLLCDLGLPDGHGLTLIAEAARRHPEADIIVITVFADQRNVLASIQNGARGYLLKDQSVDKCIDAIRDIRAGGSPISPVIARQLLNRLLPPGAEETASAERLSDREHAVLNLLARGYSYVECAGMLTVSPHTIGTFVKRIYRKLEVNSRAEAVFEASARGIIATH